MSSLAVIVGLGGWVGFTKQLHTERIQSDEARSEALQRYRLARDSIDKLTELSEDPDLEREGMHPFRKRLLDQARAASGESPERCFGTLRPDGRLLRFGLGEWQRPQVGRIHRGLRTSHRDSGVVDTTDSDRRWLSLEVGTGVLPTRFNLGSPPFLLKVV